MEKLVLTRRAFYKALLPNLNERTKDFLLYLGGTQDLIDAALKVLVTYRKGTKSINDDDTYYISFKLENEDDDSKPVHTYRFNDKIGGLYESFLERRNFTHKLDNYNITVYDDLEDLRKSFTSIMKLIESPLIGKALAEIFEDTDKDIDIIEIFYQLENTNYTGIQVTL